MGKKSSIEWTERTWNPWQGCKKVSAGCRNCYMFRDKKRFGQDPNRIHKSINATFRFPLKWESGLVFTCSWSDFFIEEADEWRKDAWDIIRETPNLTYQILTKRPERILDNLPDYWGNGWENVWFGVTVEAHENINRMKILQKIPAKVRFISVEPMLEMINFGKLSKIHWVICGGESGPGFRPLNERWVYDLLGQCAIAQVPFFFKQWGGTKKIDGAWGGKKINGLIYQNFPDCERK